MKVRDFVEINIEHNSLVRLVYKIPGGHKLVLNNWSDVDMEHQILKGRGKFSRFLDHEVIGITSILTPGNYPEAINIVIKEIPVEELRHERLGEIGICVI